MPRGKHREKPRPGVGRGGGVPRALSAYHIYIIYYINNMDWLRTNEVKSPSRGYIALNYHEKRAYHLIIDIFDAKGKSRRVQRPEMETT